MSNAWGRNVVVLAVSAVCLIAAAGEQAPNQTTNSERGAETANRETVKGRLPRYFASLVDSEQRIEIYLIQAKYRQQITELKQELAKLETKQMQDIEGVLTTDQRDKLVGFRKSTRKKAGSSNATGKGRSAAASGNDPLDAEPTATPQGSDTSNE
jgi:TolA-binding protein